MKEGEFPDGAHVLRLKIDLASPNMNMRDPAIYRILLQRPLPHQHEFARLNLTYTVMSKRKLIELVAGGYVDGWDDPRMPTLVGLRRRGYTPEAIRLFAERIGVSKAHQWIDMGVLEDCLREDLNERAERRVAVLDPLKLVIDNYPEGQEEECFAPNHPQKPDAGRRTLILSRELWIERDDYQENPPKGYFRLSPGAEVRLRYGYIVKCTGTERDAQGNIGAVHCTYDPATRSGTPGAETRKVKGNIHWLSVNHARTAEVRLYDRLFSVPEPGRSAAALETSAGTATGPASADLEDDVPFDEPTERNYLDDLNPRGRQVVTAYVEPALALAKREDRYQFERHGYFIADAKDHDAKQPVFNRAVTLRDPWAKASPAKR